MKRTLEKPAFEEINPDKSESITVRQFSNLWDGNPFGSIHSRDPILPAATVHGNCGF